MNHHHLKCIEPFFTEVREFRKTFELRFNDRDYQDGDGFTLHLWDPNTNTFVGPSVEGRITYMLEGFAGLMPGYCVFGVELS